MRKSQKGVTMISLVLYVASFLAVTAVVAGITTFFYNNVEVLDTKIGSNSQYNKLNLYMLTECKRENNSLYAWKNNPAVSGTVNKLDALSASTSIKNSLGPFITFKDDIGNKYSFIYIAGDNNLYYARKNASDGAVHLIKLCENVNEFKFKIEYTSGKTVLKIFVNIDGIAFTTEYVVAS